MAISYTQTDTTGDCSGTGAYCSGLSNSNGTSRECTDGGTAGSTEVTVNRTIPAQASDVACVMQFSLVVDGAVSWDSGTWTVRWNLTTANMFCTWDSVHICRVNSSCTSQESLGSSSGLGISLSSTGVKSTTVSGSAATPSAGDLVQIVFGFSSSSMNDQIIGWTPDQNIDSPFTDASTNVVTNLESFTFSTFGATVNAETNVQASLKSFTFSTFPADVKLAINIPTNLESFTFSTFPASITHNVNVNTNLASFTFSPQQAIVNAETNVQANLTSFSFGTFPATISLHHFIDANLASFTFSPQQANVNAETNVNSNLKSFTFSTFPATVSLGVVVNTNLRSFTFSTFPATVNAETNVNTVLKSFTFSTFPATIDLSSPGTNVITNLKSFTFSTFAATIVAASGGSYGDIPYRRRRRRM